MSFEYLKELYPDFDHVRWVVTAKMIHVRLCHGNFEASRNCLNDFMVDTCAGYATLESHVSTVFPTRLAIAMEDAGYTNVNAVMSATDAQLLALHYFGQDSLDTVRQIGRAVIRGDVPKISRSEADEILGTNYLASQIDFSKGKPVMSQSNSITIKAALTVLLSQKSEALEAIQQEITELQEQLAELKQMAKLLGARVANNSTTRERKPQQRHPLQGHWVDVEEKIVDYVVTHGPHPPKVLGKVFDLDPKRIGFIVARSAKLRKNGSVIEAALESQAA